MNSSAIRTHSSAPHGQHYLSLAINDIEQIWNCTFIWYWQMLKLRLNLALTKNNFQIHSNLTLTNLKLHLNVTFDILKTKILCRISPSMFFCDVFICIFFTRTAVLAATARQRRTTAQPGTCRVWWHFSSRHLIINLNYNSVQICIWLESNASNITQTGNIFIGKWPVTKKRGQDNHQQHYYK